MTKKLFLGILVIAVIVVGVVMFGKKEPAKIVVDAPKMGATVTNPLTVTGKARGGWYFEASFPVKLLDALGKEIAAAPAQAQGEWMTEDFVPFVATLAFSVPTAQYGTLVLMKDNPSGLPENDEQIEVSVWLDPAGNGTVVPETKVKAFFGNSTKQGDVCSAVFPVEHSVPQTQAVARAALDELLKGPTSAEKDAGFTTVIPVGVVVQSLDIKNGVAHVDFSSELDAGVAGSCRVTAIRSEIESTLKQFSTVQSVVISIDGKTDDILQP